MKNKSPFVAQMSLTSVFIGSFEPILTISSSCKTLNNFACIDNDKHPISSKKMVPPSAASNLPILRSVEPVKEPLSLPNSSASKRLSGIAAQLTAIKGLLALLLILCILFATTSLPVPVSPVIRTVVSNGAILLICSNKSFITVDLPIISDGEFSTSVL